MEEYINEAPRMVSVPTETLKKTPSLLKMQMSLSSMKLSQSQPMMWLCQMTSLPLHLHLPHQLSTARTLGLNFDAPNASSFDESNALALAIVPTDGTSNGSAGFQAKDFDPTGWELELVTTPSTDISSFQERQLGGGLDSLTLNSLYDEGAYRAAQQPVYGSPAPNPYEVSDPFHAAPEPAAMANPFGPYQPAQPQQNLMMDAPNPFVGLGFGPLPVSGGGHPQTTNPFGAALL